MMKRLLTPFFIALSFFAQAQKITQLEGVGSGSAIKPGEAIIYGNFIQKLSFWSSGYQQYVRIRNLNTRELMVFQVKSIYSGAKMRPFCYYIPAGNYEIVQYFYNESKWYGTRNVIVPIFKHIDMNTNVKRALDSGMLHQDDLHHFTFKVEPGSIAYLGTWHFDMGMVLFTDEKQALTEKIKGDHKDVDFTKAVTVVPD